MQPNARPRIVIEDLPPLETLTAEEMAQIVGAGRTRLSLESLEDRRLMAASVFSTLANVSAQFDLTAQSRVLMTEGGVQTDMGPGVQQLFQGHDAAGDQVVFEQLANNTLAEFNGQNFVNMGEADQVAQDAAGSLVFTRGSDLFLATGTPGDVVSFLHGVQGLTTNAAGQNEIQIGSYLKADMAETVDPASGAVTVSFSNVQINVGAFAGDFLGKVTTDLQAFAKPLTPLADALTNPVVDTSWAKQFGLTTYQLLDTLGYHDASQNAKALGDAIHAINALSVPTATDSGWLNLGGFTAQVQAPGAAAPLQTLSVSVADGATAALQQQLDSLGLTTAINQLQQIQGVQIALNDPAQLFKLLTGEGATLFSYTMSYSIDVGDFSERLATVPISPETATTIDIDLAPASLSISGGATFGFDTSGFQSGNLANGFFVQNANLSASVTVGISGTLDEASLIGYRLTGEMIGTMTVGLSGADASGKVYGDQITSSGLTVSNSITNKIVSGVVGPQELLGETLKEVQQVGEAAIDAAAKAIGISPTDLTNAIKTYYGADPQAAAAALQQAGVSADKLAAVLKDAYNAAPVDAARILYALNVAGADLTQAIQNSFNVTVNYWRDGTKEVYQELSNGAVTLERDWVNGVKTLEATWAGGAATLNYVWNTAGQQVSQYWVSGTQAFQNLFTNGALTGYTVWTNGVVTLQNAYNAAGTLLNSYWQSGSKFIYQEYANGAVTLERDWVNGVKTLEATWANGVNTLNYVWNTAGQQVSQYWVSGTQAFQNLFTNGARTAYTVWTSGVVTLQNAYNAAGTLLNSYWQSGSKFIYQAYSNGAVTLERDYQNGVQIMYATWSGGVNTLYYVWNTAGQQVSQYWVSGNQAFQNLFTNGARTAYTVWTGGVETLQNAYSTAGTLLNSYWQSGSKFIYQAYSNGAVTLERDYQNGVQIMYATWSGGVNTLYYVWNTAGQQVSQYWVSGNQAFQNLFTNGVRVAQNVWTNGVQTAQYVWNQAGAYLGNAWNNAGSAASNFFKNLGL